MKRYHECAVVKDGNKRVGYFVQNTGGSSLSSNGAMGAPWNLLSAADFENLVKSDQVQYLIYDNGIKCRYTDEEKAYLLKMPGVKKNFIKETEKNYFSMDCTFSFKHIDAATNGFPVVAGSVGQITKMFGQNFALFYFYGFSQNIAKFSQEICYIVPHCSDLLNINGVVMRAMLPLAYAEKVFSSTSIKPLFNTATLKYIRNHQESTSRIKLIQRTPKSSVIDAAIDLFDNFTNTFSSMLNIS